MIGVFFSMSFTHEMLCTPTCVQRRQCRSVSATKGIRHHRQQALTPERAASGVKVRLAKTSGVVWNPSDSHILPRRFLTPDNLMAWSLGCP